MSVVRSMNCVRFGTCAALLFVCAASFSISASAETLSGRVLDPKGNTVAGAELRLFDRSSGALRTTRSTDEGAFSFQSLPQGKYLLEADSSSVSLGGSQEVVIAGDEKLDLNLAILGARTEVRVIASGTPLNVDEIAKAVDVVDSEEIALRDEISIPDSIRSLPGLRVQTLEGPGSMTTIQMRGLRSQDTAVLIDGMRFRDASGITGDASGFFEDMGVIDTDRIEVLRGSGSSLYGSHAVGGVISIRSRQGGGALHGQFLGEAGGLGMFRNVFTAGAGIAADRLTFSLGLSNLNVTKGPRNGLPYRNTGTQGTAKYSIADNMSLTGRLWYSKSYLASTESPFVNPDVLANAPAEGEVKAIPLPIDQLKLFEKGEPFTVGNATYIPNQIDPDGRRHGEFFSGSLMLQHRISEETSYQLTYQSVLASRTYTDGPGGTGPFEQLDPSSIGFKGYTNIFQALVDRRVGRHMRITAGYEYERERFVNYTGFAFGLPSSSWSLKLLQRSNAFYYQDQISLADGKLQISLGGRAQFFNLKPPKFAGFASPYDGAAALEPPTAYTGDGAVAYFFRSTGTKLRAHAGNSFRAPSGFERFSGDSGFFYGDPTLKPERSVAYDAGIDQKLFNSKLTLSSTAFYTNLQQTILFANSLDSSSDPFGRSFGYQNGGGGLSRGLEYSAHLSPTSRLNLGASYTYVYSYSRIPTIGSTYNKVLGQSPRLFTATATQWIGRRTNITFDMSAYSKYSLTLSGAADRQFVFDGPVKADAVFHHERPFRDRQTLEFYVKVENLLNRREHENGFIGPKAWAVGGIRFKY